MERKEIRGPFGWENCDERIKGFIDGFLELLLDRLKDSLTGLYLHGSLAMGSFYYPKSDLDLIGVASRRLSEGEAKGLNREIAAYAGKAPGEGGLEFSLVCGEAALHPAAQPEYLVHYSGFWRERILRDEVDYRGPLFDGDLPAHFWTVRQRGVRLYGAPVEEVFGEVRFSDLKASLEEDFRWILNGKLFSDPCYGILNICRLLQLFSGEETGCHSKEEGGLWALSHLPKEHREPVRKALECYRTGSCGAGWDRAELEGFAAYAAGHPALAFSRTVCYT